MNNAEILVAHKPAAFKLKIIGRATFAVSPTLRQLVQEIEDDPDKKDVSIDLTECTGMDSTFMGILAMLALKLRKNNITIKIVNAGQNKALLNGLGLKKLFNYVEEESTGNNWKKTGSTPPLHDKAETVLQAHKVLMEADEGNIEKFHTVVDMMEKELQK